MAPQESLRRLEMGEVVKYTIENFGSSYSTGMFVVMNKDKWNSLPPPLVITCITGPPLPAYSAWYPFMITLTSPINGVVTQLNVELGEVVVTGTMNQPGTVIMMLGDMGEMEVEAEVDETDMKDIQLGQPAEIKVDALRDTVLTGVVTTVGNAATKAVVSGIVAIVIVDGVFAVAYYFLGI
jgi:hypothetical protein